MASNCAVWQTMDSSTQVVVIVICDHGIATNSGWYPYLARSRYKFVSGASISVWRAYIISWKQITQLPSTAKTSRPRQLVSMFSLCRTPSAWPYPSPCCLNGAKDNRNSRSTTRIFQLTTPQAPESSSRNALRHNADSEYPHNLKQHQSHLGHETKFRKRLLARIISTVIQGSRPLYDKCPLPGAQRKRQDSSSHEYASPDSVQQKGSKRDCVT